MSRRFRATVLAQREARVAERWWRKHHPGSADLFRAEVERGIASIVEIPELGVMYPRPRGRSTRRLALLRISYSLYYRVDEDEVVLLHVWHTSRGRSPFEK